MAAALNAGEGTQEQLSEAKVVRLKLLKLAEIVDATSKKIASLDVDGDNDGNDYSYGVTYTVDGMALAYSSNKAEPWTASSSYEIGASAVAQQNYTGDMQIGVSMSF